MNTKDRFLKYISYDTTSYEDSPNNNNELLFAKELLKELEMMGIEGILSDKGYVYATIKKNTDSNKKIGFIAHMDTSNAISGKNIKPVFVKRTHDTIIKSDGTTLLGADDKAGIAAIMTMIERIDRIPHCEIKIAFTPDEEIGCGTAYFDVKYFDVDFAFTIDGGILGEINHENFNAASAKVTIKGHNTHPGDAKDKMINSAKLGLEFDGLLPSLMVPEKTSGYEGFNHLLEINGTVEKTVLSYIIRNHQKDDFEKQKQQFNIIAEQLNKKYKSNLVNIDIKDTYYNMNDILKDHLDIIDVVISAMKKLDIKPIIKPIRGGTDGALLTYQGIICPNLGTGGENFHSVDEFVSVEDMEKNVLLLLEIIKQTSNLN